MKSFAVFGIIVVLLSSTDVAYEEGHSLTNTTSTEPACQLADNWLSMIPLQIYVWSRSSKYMQLSRSRRTKETSNAYIFA
ncbi:hypothetical protein OS493_036577 [Desmophyllum pertusum]|uniref:Uncharacterized protein n=1 Tax=Desmophyllum pertusum TaxID=174260 RepID=A0A9W9YAI9_9CNID|nr:hypothetical protein OS493_036577 [Desmophyllum pertusum]